MGIRDADSELGMDLGDSTSRLGMGLGDADSRLCLGMEDEQPDRAGLKWGQEQAEYTGSYPEDSNMI
jgi:hypothetical protein